MITLSAKIEIIGHNETPFVLGESAIGDGYAIGEEVNALVDINRRRLSSLDGEIADRADFSIPNWGVISNKGTMSFKDLNFRFLGYAELGLLKDGAKVTLFLSNSLKKCSQKVGEYYANGWGYDNNNFLVSVSLNDGLEDWQDIVFEGLAYHPSQSISMTFQDVYELLSSFTNSNSKVKMMDFEDLDTETKTFMSKTTVFYPTIESGSLWSAWEKFAVATQSHIFKTKEGVSTCRRNGGN